MTSFVRSLAAALAVHFAGAAVAVAAPADEARHAWKVKRPVSLLETRTPAQRAPDATETERPLTWARLDVPPEVEGESQPGLADLRLVDAAGDEVPYALVTAHAAPPCAGNLTDVQKREKVSSTYTVELERECRFDALALRLPGVDFAKSVVVEVGDDGSKWRPLVRGASVFDQAWGGRVHHDRVVLAEAVTARFVRLRFDDAATPPVDLEGVQVASSSSDGPARWSRPVGLGAPRRAGADRVYPVKTPPLPFDRLSITARDGFFAREVTLVARTKDGAGRPVETTLGHGMVYRFTAVPGARAGEDLGIEVAAPPAGAELELRVADRDNRALEGLAAVVSGPQRSLVFTTTGAAPTALWYGNPQTRPPGYDLASVGDQLSRDEVAVIYGAGAEQPNPSYRPMPPLSFVDSRGAALDLDRYLWQRPIETAAADDVYAVVLEPEDLARAQPDLADLRIVDGQGEQVPYVLESAVGERWIDLGLVKADGAGRRGVSRWGLEIKGLAEGLTMPLGAVTVDVAERFFSRSIFVTVPLSRGEGRRVAYSGVLARRADETGPVTLGLGAVRARELALEIEDGDNAPLTLTAARARVLTPRLAFKWKGSKGGLRLVYGSRRATAPHYDLGTLRGEVLAYAAQPAKLGPLDKNPVYGGIAGDIGDLSNARTVLWITLVVLVAGLLLVAVRLVKKLAPTK